MKGKYIMCAALATLALMSSCKKEEEGTLTLNLVINQPSKVYIGNINEHMYPCWNDGDEVFVNTQSYPVSNADGTTAQLAGVAYSQTSEFRAVYPASIVTSTDITSNATVNVTLDPQQTYATDGTNQKVNIPMGAYREGAGNLMFNNLCSVVRVTVQNPTPEVLTVNSITITAATALLSGTGTANVSGTTSDAITLTSGSHSVALVGTEATPMTVPAGTVNTPSTATFDVVVPEFTAQDITITVATNQYTQTYSLTNVALTHSSLTSYTASTKPVYAFLSSGQVVRNKLQPLNATHVLFDYESNYEGTGNNIIANNTSSNKYASVYGHMDDDTYIISTPAKIILLSTDENYNEMFQNCSTLVSINFVGNNEAEGTGFNTDNMKSMNYMFQNCSALESITGIDKFNTSNVGTMNSTFENCYQLRELDVSHWNTENVTVMTFLFCNCSTLTQLNVSNFNTERVNFMGKMFYNCNHLTSLDLSNFKTDNVQYMYYMFAECTRLSNLNLGSKFNMNNCTSYNQITTNLGTETDSHDSHAHYCAITCIQNVKNILDDFTPSSVYFDWDIVSPSSK